MKNTVKYGMIWAPITIIIDYDERTGNNFRLIPRHFRVKSILDLNCYFIIIINFIVYPTIQIR